MYYRIIDNQIVATYQEDVKSVYLYDIDDHIKVEDFQQYGIYKVRYQSEDYNELTHKIANYTLQIINGFPVNVANIVPRAEDEVTAIIENNRAHMAVSMRQARLALLQSNLLQHVDAALDTLPEPQRSAAKITWEYAIEVRRTDSLVLSLMQLLNLSDSEVDNLFDVASAL